MGLRATMWMTGSPTTRANAAKKRTRGKFGARTTNVVTEITTTVGITKMVATIIGTTDLRARGTRQRVSYRAGRVAVPG